MRAQGRIWGAGALVLVLGVLGAGVASADEPEPAPPAAQIGDSSRLAEYDQVATRAVGSTAGFPAATEFEPGRTRLPPYTISAPYSPVSGATGLWSLTGPYNASFTIDSCGSSFPVQLTVYQADARDGIASESAYSADACADPIALDFSAASNDFTSHPLIRIDDATGAGGTYQLNYQRTPGGARIGRIRIGDVKRVGKRRRVGRTTVAVRFGAYPDYTLCRLDDTSESNCSAAATTSSGARKIVYRDVRSGSHVFRLTGIEAAGSSTVAKRFRVPFRKPRTGG